MIIEIHTNPQQTEWGFIIPELELKERHFKSQTEAKEAADSIVLSHQLGLI